MRKLTKIYSVLFFIVAFLSSASNTFADVVYVTPLNGKEHKIGNLLRWVTSNEFNSQVFIVEKSIDGTDFEGIGEVLAGGISQKEKGYRFLDVETTDLKAFYRLRQVDIDGTANYSQTIMVQKKMNNDIMILSMSNTVTHDKFNVTLDALIDGEIEFTLKNAVHEVIINRKKEIVYGLNEITVSLKDEPEGVYFLSLEIKDEVEKLTITKVNGTIQRKPSMASKLNQKGF